MAEVAAVPRESVSSSAESSTLDDDLKEESRENIAELPAIASTTKHPMKKLVRQGSVSDNFYAVKGAALILPKQTSVAVENMQLLRQFGGELQTHLRGIFQHLRPQDNIKLAVRLESWQESHRRYLVVISTIGRQDTEESIIVGCDFDSKESKICTIGLVLPVWCDTNIRLDGDGGFHVEGREGTNTFKPVSVQAMWSALQSLNRCVDVARKNNYFEGSLYLTWTGYYSSKVTSDRIYVNEWNYREMYTVPKDYFEKTDPKRLPVERLIRNTLKQVMMDMDLDKCTSRDIRVALESVIDMDLKDYKEYIDTEMLTVLGQMDCASQILDFLYLGSEWNASNLEELEELKITHILNVTSEVDNFYPDDFSYKNVRLLDVETSDLLPHWNHTWKFIAEAKKSGGKCLVHCRMGISRSAATVCAYLMKSKLWTKCQAIKYVKERRSIICPNPGFQKQLDEYEGIVFASAQRHNQLFRSRSASCLAETNEERQHQSAAASPLPSAPPAIQISDSTPDYNITVSSEDFDLNRHLLDIATLSTPKTSRPKSWSPDEGRSPYISSNVDTVDTRLSTSDSTNHSLHIQNLSEPVELLVPSSGEFARNDLRKNVNKRDILRRQIDGAAFSLGGMDELAHSEDSVFVHDGNNPDLNAGPESLLVKEAKSRRSPPRSSSPAALGGSTKQKDDLDPLSFRDLQGTGVMSSSRDLTCDVSEPSPSGPEAKRVEKSAFAKRHHKTMSLPPPLNQTDPVLMKAEPVEKESERDRERSFSEAQTSVKEIVTAIENLNSPEDEKVEGMRRSASLPYWRKKEGAPDPVVCNFSLFQQRIPETDANSSAEELALGQEASGFYIGDRSARSLSSTPPSDANSNNSNNRVIEQGFKDVAVSAIVTSSPRDLSASGRQGLSPELLHAIREVGVRLTNSDEFASSESSCMSASSAKKRGIVLQMVREIENGVRKLTGKKILRGKKKLSASSGPSEERTSVEEAVENLSPEYNNPAEQEAKLSSVIGDANPVSLETLSPSAAKLFTLPHLTALVTPTPYRTPDNRKTSSGSFRFKLSVTAPRVRRTQSEKTGTKPQIFKKPGYFRSLRSTKSNLPALHCPLSNSKSEASNTRSFDLDLPFERNTSSSLRFSKSSNMTSVLRNRSNSLPQILNLSS